MRAYTCRLHNRNGTVDCYDLGDFVTPEDAMRAARSALLVSLCATSAELWSGEIRLASVDRDSAQFRGPGAPGAAWDALAATPAGYSRRLA